MHLDQERSVLQIARLATQARQEFVEHKGRRVCWRCFGTGPFVVLLHGGHGNWLHWFRNIETLAMHYTVLVPDLPGYGDSDEPIPSGGLSALLDLTIATLNQLVGADSSINLVGFSFGGLVAAHIASQRPHVRHLVLLGPTGHRGRRRPRGELQSWKMAAQLTDELSVAAVMRHNLAVHMLSTAKDDIDPLAVHIHTKACLHTRFRSKEISQSGGLPETLRQRSGSSLLVWGEHDVTAEPEVISRALLEWVPDCKTQLIEGAGHWVQFERADDINRLLLAWFSTDPKDMT